ncbi:MAG TPA: efflux RND transporter periplasmic adaptor subunit [Stellaceae bacterium]|nr:efflux RND transporter periplasmic adaptor subunit [Stellaceae bacterium]
MLRRWIFIVAVPIAGVGLAILLGIGPLARPERAPAATSGTPAAVPVWAETAVRKDVPIYVTGIGTVQAFNSVLVKARVDGQIVKVDFTEGQTLRAGDLVAEIDPAPFQAALAQAQATKLKDEAQLAMARLDDTRASRLAATGNGSQQQRDAAHSLVAQLEAAAKSDEAAIQAAQVQLDYTRIRSPIDGRAGVRMLDVGNIVHASDTGGIVMINQIHPIYVTYSLPADILPMARAQAQAGAIEVIAESGDGKPLATGKLAVIDNQINTATATLTYKAVFENSDSALWPGQFVNVRMTVGTRLNVVTVPASAVLHDPNGSYAFVVGVGGVAQKRVVKVGWADGSVAVIDQGIEAGETVISNGQYRVQPGAPVTVLPPDGTPPQQTGQEPSP